MPTKKTAKKAAKKITLKDSTLYVVSVRNNWLGWEPALVTETYELAQVYRDLYESTSPIMLKAAKITKIDLVNAPPQDSE